MKIFKFFILIISTNFIQSFDDMNESSLSAQEVPHMITGNVNITTYVGDTVTLPCEVAHLGNYHVNWLKIHNNVPLTLTVGYQQFSRNMRYRVARVHDNSNKNKVESWNFEIRKVTLEDSGLYQCYIKLNSKHKIKANVNLIVKPESDVLDNPRSERLSSNLLEKIDMPPNSWVKLRCNATGIVSLTLNKAEATGRSSTSDLQWYKDGRLIEQDSRRLKKWVSSYDNSNYMELELYAVDPDDSGVYQCKRDKTVLKNVVLQVIDSNKGSCLISYNKAFMVLIYLLMSVLISKMSIF